MKDTIERKRLAILRILNEARAPLVSQRITEKMLALGYDISERTVRFHLLSLDKEDMTEDLGKHGRSITEKGIKELNRARVFEKVGFLAAKIDQMIYQMDFNLERQEGDVVTNVSLVEKRHIARAVPLICRVFKAGFSMGRLLTLFKAGEKIGELDVPDGYIGIGTVCSITLNGVLLSYGIPTNSRFGGLLEMKNWEPARFVAIINYDGTTLDPLEIFIKSGMTDYTEATESGNGQIGASFREMPASSRDRVIELAAKLEQVGLGGFMRVGWPGQSLLEIPINEGRIGAIIIGGLNPVAILEEVDIPVYSHTLSGYVDFKRLFPYEELEQRINDV
jgi:repressor of nif and glnA expression